MQIQNEIKNYFSVMSELTDNYLYICNMNTGVFLYSPQLVKLFQLPSNRLKNPLTVWKEIVHPEDWEQFEKANTEIGTNGNDSHSIYFRAKAFDGEYILMKCRGKVIRDENGEASVFAGIMTELSITDKYSSLSSIHTRKELNKALDEKMSELPHDYFAVMTFNVDNMRYLNEIYGRKTGDFITHEVKTIIADVLKDRGTAYKLEGDYFCAIIDIRTEKEATALFAEIQNEMTNIFSRYLSKSLVNVSAGCAFYRKDAFDRDALLNACDIALKYAKANGKNRLAFYDTLMWNKEKREKDIHVLLEVSKRNKFSNFYLQYQPLVFADSQEIHGVEALLRWNCPELGSISPLEFIPALEQNELIIPLGLSVFRQAVKDAKQWIAYNPDFVVSINISPIQIQQNNFMTEIIQIIEEEQFPAEKIVLELTESCIIKNTEQVKYTLHQLRLLGFQIAIDDFGTGYSSLSLLKNLPVDYIKLDKIFIRDISRNSVDQMFVKTIAEFAHYMGYKILQEGVETEEEFEEIKSLGIDYIQGFLFSRPQNEEQITKMLCASA